MDDRSRIRAVFLDRREMYSMSETVHLSGVGEHDLLDRIKTGEVDARTTVTHRIPWDDVARLLMEHVPLSTIYDALGDRADDVLPSLLRLERLDIPVPAYVIRAFEWVATREGRNVEQYFHQQLFDIVESLWRTAAGMQTDLPGVGEALFFPDLQDGADPAGRMPA